MRNRQLFSRFIASGALGMGLFLNVPYSHGQSVLRCEQIYSGWIHFDRYHNQNDPEHDPKLLGFYVGYIGAAVSVYQTNLMREPLRLPIMTIDSFGQAIGGWLNRNIEKVSDMDAQSCVYRALQEHFG